MNFFNSVFSDDPDPPKPESESNNADPDSDSDSGNNTGGDTWNFGGLIKTLTAKSESIIETYRRDLQEFSTGLKTEIEVAQGSVGHVIDEFGNTVIKGTAQIISHGKDAILAVNLDSDSDNGGSSSHRKQGGEKGEKGSGSSKGYSRFDAQVRAIQGDVNTYSEAPEDLGEFEKWKSGFSLDGKGDEIEGLFRENEAMESVYKRVVPNVVDHESFWFRYYYKVYRLKKAEDVRARLVRRMSREEEELSWDFEEDVDDGDEKAYEGGGKPEVGGESVEKKVDTQLQIGGSGSANNEGEAKRMSAEEVQHSGEEETKVEGKDSFLQSKEVGKEMEKSVRELRDEKSEAGNEMGGGCKVATEEAGVDKASKSLVGGDGASKSDSAAESDGKVVKEMEGGDGKSTRKNNESSVVESQKSANVEEDEEEEDLGWDEIEDLSSVDEKKVSQSGSTSQVDLRKRLSTAEDDEDLSWDIEDDDEPAKA
ncbi:uncharacterized protein LOC130717896 [Lotus japonicus]|uniref:uncharacterized protein LOC130717896 n=1 Tax=Lotus japonicus TaxID=34305 RepID=UPI0025910FF9|nr:uncharacterized protein LOC130717896 [Lotus japonicus]